MSKLILLIFSLLGQEKSQACSHGDIRIIGNGRTPPNVGRVEVCLHGSWGTVCDDRWDIRDAAVVCRQLGLEAVAAIQRFGGGRGLILMDEVSCTGHESCLLDCGYTNRHDCSHSEDAGVNCTERSSINIQLEVINSSTLFIEWKTSTFPEMIKSYIVSISHTEEYKNQLFNVNRSRSLNQTNVTWSQDFVANATYMVCVESDYIVCTISPLKTCKNWTSSEIHYDTQNQGGTATLPVTYDDEQSCVCRNISSGASVSLAFLAVFVILLSLILGAIVAYWLGMRSRRQKKERELHPSDFHTSKKAIQDSSAQPSTGIDNLNYEICDWETDVNSVEQRPAYQPLQPRISDLPSPYEVPTKISS